jgi:general secretion pathway protein A
MYHHFYHLKHDPFADAPDPEFLFLSPSHKTALQTLLSGIEGRRGLMAIFGAAGLGKTILLRAFLEGIHEQQHLKTMQIFYPNISCQDMFEILYRGLGLDRTTDNPEELLSQLHQALIAEYDRGWNVALLVDDVQDMGEQTLENLLRLSDLQTSTGVPLMQIVLVGLPAMWRTLHRPPLRPFLQRLASRVTLKPLPPKESLAYIRHRLAKVLIPEEALFMSGALKQIIRAARGNPRVLNTLCANVLITGVLREQKPISLALAQDVLAESGESLPRAYWRWLGGAVAGGLLAAGLWSGWQWYGQKGARQVDAIQTATRPQEAASSTLYVVSVPAPSDNTGTGGSEATKVPKPEGPALKGRAAAEKPGILQRDPPRILKPPGKNAAPEKAPPGKPQAPTEKAQSPKREAALQPAPRKTAAANIRALNIHSHPAGATITIDQKMVGKTPLAVRLPTGVHTITLEKPGYTRVSYDINLHNHHNGALYYDLHQSGGNH